MCLQSIPKVTRAEETEMQLCLAWEFIDWVIEKYPDAYDEYQKEVVK